MGAPPSLRDVARPLAAIVLLGALLCLLLAAASGYLPAMLRAAGLSGG